MADILFHVHYIAAKVGKTGLVPTIDVHRVTRSSGAHAEIVTAGNMTETGDGLYHYLLSGADLTLYDYSAVAKTADATVDQQHLACLWTLWSLSWHDILTTALTAVGSIGKLFVDMLNATVGSRAAPGAQMDIVNVPNATAVAVFSDGVWDEALAGHLGVGSTGEKLDSLCCSTGSGAVTFTYTVTSTVAPFAPVAGVHVLVATDLAGTNIIAGGYTNALGQVVFSLDTATYYLFRYRVGYSFVNPDTENVSP